MPWIDVDQSSEEWLHMRTGMCTASRLGDILGRLKINTKDGKKGDYKKTRYGYMMELVGEHLTGRASSRYYNEWMERGKLMEKTAVEAYERDCDELVVYPGGFAIHDANKYFGASPDALVGSVGLYEVKCLKIENHLEIVKAKQIPEERFPQLNGQLACMPEREWVDAGYFNADIKIPHLRQLIIRHYRDRGRIRELETEVDLFLGDLANELYKITGTVPLMATAAPESQQMASEAE